MSENEKHGLHERTSEVDSSVAANNEANLERFALSLVRDDLLYRLQRRLGLIPAEGPGIARRAAWLPDHGRRRRRGAALCRGFDQAGLSYQKTMVWRMG